MLSDVSQCQACHMEEGTHRLYHYETGGLRKVGAKSEHLKEGVEMAKGYCDAVKANGTGPFQYEKVGDGEAQKVEHASRRLPGPCGH